MRLVALLLLAAVSWGCGDDACSHELYSFCRQSPTLCQQPYDTRLADLRARPKCTNEFGLTIELRTCGGRRFITETDGFGGTDYAYDDIGKLVGVRTFSDTPLTCGGDSETYGEGETCTATPDESFCVQSSTR